MLRSSLLSLYALFFLFGTYTVKGQEDEAAAGEAEATTADEASTTKATGSPADANEEDDEDGEDLSDLEPDPPAASDAAGGADAAGNLNAGAGVADNLKNAATEGMNEKMAEELKSLIDSIGDEKKLGDPEVWASLREQFSPELKDAFGKMMSDMEGKLKTNPGAGAGAGSMMGGTKPHLRNFCLAGEEMDARTAQLVQDTAFEQVAEDENIATSDYIQRMVACFDTIMNEDTKKTKKGKMPQTVLDVIEEVGAAGDLPDMVKKVQAPDWLAIQKIAKRRLKVYETRRKAGVGQVSLLAIMCFVLVFAAIGYLGYTLLNMEKNNKEFRGPKIKTAEAKSLKKKN